jgi:putative transposase
LIDKDVRLPYLLCMARTAQPIKLRKHELRSLTTISKRGTTAARTQTRARILDLLHRRQHPDEIASLLQVSLQTIFNVKRRYLSAGFDAALFDRARSGRPIRIDGTQRAKITALACSAPPEGYARWSLRLLADKAVELQLCEAVSHNAVKEILKKTS